MKKNVTTVCGFMLFTFLLITACQKEKTIQAPESASMGASKDITENKADTKNLTERTINKSQIAQSIWENTEGDIYTFVVVFVAVYETKAQGDKNSEAEMLVAIFRSNIVTGDVLMAASSFSTNFQFNIDKKLQTAQLIGTAEMSDLSGMDNNVFPVTVEMHWTGYGEIIKEKTDKFSIEEEGFKYKSITKGESRLALAIGSVFALEENFTIGNSTEAFLSNARSGTLIIAHNN